MSSVVAEFLAAFALKRHDAVTAFPKEHAKKIVSFYDGMAAEIMNYLESKWFLNLRPVFRYHFDRVWSMNMYIIGRNDWSQTKIKRYNSASMLIGDALRIVGERHGFLPTSLPQNRP